MGKFFEIFKTQKDVEESIPKVNVESKGQEGVSFSQLDDKKITFSYTTLLFVSMMIVIGLVVVYLIGYVKSETNNLINLVGIPKNSQPANKKSESREDNSQSVVNKSSSKEKEPSPLATNSKTFLSSGSQKITTLEDSGKSSSYYVELYYGKAKPDEKFMDNLKKIVKRNLNMDIEVNTNKRGKIFYIIITSLNTEGEANKVIELLKTKKLISKSSAKIISQLVNNKQSGE